MERGPSAGSEHAFTPGKAWTIGRSETADLSIPDTKISRVHCRLQFRDGDWVVEDLDSRNGTWVGDHRVRERVLAEGDVFELGRSTAFSVRLVRAERTAGRRLPAGGAGPGAAMETTSLEPLPPLEGPLADLPGRTLGEFRVVEQARPLGRATFFRAMQPSLNRHVLLEVFTEADMAVPGAQEDLRAAVQSAARLLHPNVLQIYDYGTSRGFTYVTMEFFQGRNLGQILSEKGFVPIGRALSLSRQLVDALSAGVDAGGPVGTVSPGEIWVDKEFTLKVKLFREPGSPPPPVAHAGYQAPEVLDGGDAADPRAAVYTVGALLYHMLAATPPVHGESREEIARRARHDTPPPLRRVNIKVTAMLARVVEQAVAKDPAARQPGLRELARDLHRTTAPTL